MADTLHLSLHRTDTPIGEMLLIADNDGNLRALDWSDHETRMRRLLGLHYGEKGYVLHPTASQSKLLDALHSYFAGDLAALDAIPVSTGGTPFQRTVWKALRDIRCGSTLCYAELAARIGRPAAVRAVGLANGANPIGIVVPCHRVIGADGSLTGYGGGIDRKRWLLIHEGLSLHEPAGPTRSSRSAVAS